MRPGDDDHEPVSVQMTIVSMRGSRSATTPSDTGSSVFGRRVSDRRRALSGLIRKQPATNTPHQGHDEDPRPDPATPACGLNASTTIVAKAPGTLPKVEHEDQQGAKDVNRRHERGEERRHLTDPSDTAQDHLRNDHGRDRTHDDSRDAERAVHLVGNGVGLDRIAR